MLIDIFAELKYAIFSGKNQSLPAIGPMEKILFINLLCIKRGIITTSYLRTEDLIRSVKENLPYINEPVKANFEAFVYEAELINIPSPKLAVTVTKPLSYLAGTVAVTESIALVVE